MCGRFSLALEDRALREYLLEVFDISRVNVAPSMRYNISPSQDILCVIHDKTDYRVGMIPWGFIPSYEKDKEKPLKIINARIEGIEKNGAFRTSFESKRCIILSDGYYEWNERKVPHRILDENREVLLFAGVYNTFRKEGEILQASCAIVTTSAREDVSTLHTRMPLILTEEEAKTYLMDPTFVIDKVSQQIQLSYYPIDSSINRPTSQNPIFHQRRTAHD